jgi:hypothetical protein
MTELTMNPSADDLVFGGYTDYASAHVAASAAWAGVSGVPYVGQDFDEYATYHVYRFLFCYDTSVIPVGAVITRARLLFGFYEIINADGDFDLELTYQDWSAQRPVTADNDWLAFNACLVADKELTLITIDGTVNTGESYFSPDLDITHINPLGYTYFSLRSSDDSNAVPPVNGNRVRFESYLTLYIDYASCPPPAIYVGDGVTYS